VEVETNLEEIAVLAKSVVRQAGEVDERKTIYMSARNIRGVAVSPAADFNAYNVLKPKRLVLTKAALEELCDGVKYGPAPTAQA
jgi:ribosomal protein L4